MTKKTTTRRARRAKKPEPTDKIVRIAAGEALLYTPNGDKPVRVPGLYVVTVRDEVFFWDWEDWVQIPNISEYMTEEDDEDEDEDDEDEDDDED